MASRKNRTAPISGQSSDPAAEHGRVLRSAGVVAAITLVSRVAGYGRDIVAAYFFGTGLYADAFVAAFRLPNILRRLVGEGNVSAAFVPVFEREARHRDDDDLWPLADSFHMAIAMAASLLTVIGMLAAPFLVRVVLMPGNPDAWELTTTLVWITFPYLIFISATSALMAVLNARDKFTAAAFTPVLYNVTLMASALVMARSETPIYVWAAAAVLGGFLQWLSLVPHARRMGMRLWPPRGFSDPALRKIGALMVPGLFGVGITQINALVGQAFASWLVVGSVASLFYAGRLTELPLGVFAIAIATVVLPLMSRQAAAGDHEGMRRTLNFALRQVAFITLPASVGLVILRTEIVTILFEWGGAFDADSTAKTAGALAGYAVGLVAFAGVRIVAPGFFAMKDTRTPVVAAAVAMVVNVVACFALIPLWGHVGIALASSTAGLVNVSLLLVLYVRKAGGFGGARFAAGIVRLVIAAAVMGRVVWWVRDNGLAVIDGGVLVHAAGLGVTIGIGLLTYLLAATVLRAPELAELRALRRGGGK